MSNKLKVISRLLKDIIEKYSISYSVYENFENKSFELEIEVDSSKYHMLGSNYDNNYWHFFSFDIEDEITESLELGGLEDQLEKIIFKHKNYQFMEDNIINLQGYLTERLRKLSSGLGVKVEIIGPYFSKNVPELTYRLKFPKGLDDNKKKMIAKFIPSVYDDLNFRLIP